MYKLENIIHMRIFKKSFDDTKSVIRSPNTRQYNGQKKKKGKQWSTQHQIKNNKDRATQTHMIQKVEIKFSAHEQFLELPSTLSKRVVLKTIIWLSRAVYAK